MASKSEYGGPGFNKSNLLNLSTDQGAQLEPYLNVSPHSPHPIRRSSYTSIYSDISDVEYMSNEHTGSFLKRTVSNVSDFSSYSDAGPVSLRQRLRNVYHQNYGALLVLLSQVFGSSMNVSTRILEQPGAHGAPMHPFQILFVRQLLTALLCTVYALVTKSIPYFPLGPPDTKVRLLLVSRGLCGFFGVFGLYFSLLYLPLSEAIVLTFLAPILTCYLCSIILPNEQFTRQQQIAGLVSFVGVIFIAQPITIFRSVNSSSSSHDVGGNGASMNGTMTSDPLTDHDPHRPTPGQHLLAIAIAMVGVCGATGAMTSIRAIGTRAHAFISINYFSVWSTIVCLIALIIIPSVSFRLPGNLIEWGLLINIGVSGFCLQGLLTMGLAYGGPAGESDLATTSVSLPSGSDQRTVTNKATSNDIELQAQPVSLSISSQEPDYQPRQHLHSNTRPRRSKPRPRPSGNRATAMVYCQMLFALAADKVIFGTTLGVWSWIGSGLILGGAVWVAAAKDGSGGGTGAGNYASAQEPISRQRSRDTGSIPDGEGFIVGTASTSEAVPGSGGEGQAEEQVGLLRDDELEENQRIAGSQV